MSQIVLKVVVIFEILNVLFFSPKGPVGARGPPGPPGKAGEDVCIYLCVYKHFQGPLSFTWMSETNICLCYRRVTTADPASPETEVSPAPRWDNTFLNKENETQKDTNRYLSCKYGLHLNHIFFVLTRRVLVDSPEPPDFQEWRDTEWVLIVIPLLDLTWTPPACSQLKKTELHLHCVKCGLRWLGAPLERIMEPLSSLVFFSEELTRNKKSLNGCCLRFLVPVLRENVSSVKSLCGIQVSEGSLHINQTRARLPRCLTGSSGCPCPLILFLISSVLCLCVGYFSRWS